MQPNVPNEIVPRVSSRRNKKIGLWLILAPIIGNAIVMLLWAIISFLATRSDAGLASAGASAISLGNSGTRTIVMSSISVFLGLIGVVCSLGMVVGIPLGIVFLCKKEMGSNTPHDDRSGKGDASVVPDEIQGWNWGAFGLSVIWGMYHSVWIAFLCLIPVVNIVVGIYLGIKGNELAWRKNKWQSVDEFLSVQKKWRTWGIIFFLLGVFGMLGRLGNIGNV